MRWLLIGCMETLFLKLAATIFGLPTYGITHHNSSFVFCSSSSSLVLSLCARVWISCGYLCYWLPIGSSFMPCKSMICGPSKSYCIIWFGCFLVLMALDGFFIIISFSFWILKKTPMFIVHSQLFGVSVAIFSFGWGGRGNK
jgi:hypothetical protein